MDASSGFDFWHSLESLIGAGVSLLIYALTVRKTDKKDREKQHEENLAKFNLLLHEQNERPAHRHLEASGPLTAEGISYKPPKNFNGG